jgi:asparagine synthase (glutamine-hydrolysing)
VRVILDGLEGDAAVSHGTAYPLELARRGRWLALADEIIAFSRTQGVSVPRLLWQSLRPLAPRWMHKVGLRLAGRERLRWDPVVSPDLARRVSLEERWDTRQEGWLTAVRTARDDHWRRLDSPVVTHAIETVSRVASLFSIDPRHPFLDSRLVEFALALPGDQKLHRGLTRVILRGAMAGLLPEEIRWRKGKADLRSIIPHALARAGPVRLDTVLDREAEVLAAYVDLTALRAAYVRCSRTSAPSDALTVWRVGAWLRRTAPG